MCCYSYNHTSSRKNNDYHKYNQSIKMQTLKEGHNHNMWPYIQVNPEVAIL